MSEIEKAQQVLLGLKEAEFAEPDAALKILNGLIGFVQSDNRDQPLELDEARSAAFLAICEVGKALHRAQPADHLWATAIKATEKWIARATQA